MVERYCVYAGVRPALPECECRKSGVCQFWTHSDKGKEAFTDPDLRQYVKPEPVRRPPFSWIKRRSYSGAPCPYCAKGMVYGDTELHPTLEHILAISRGGGDDPSNRIFACNRCNHNKAAWLLTEWLALLRRTGDPRADHVEAFIKSRDPVREEEAA